MMKILIASCIRQSLPVLSEFLESLDRLESPSEVEYLFTVDGLTEETRTLLDEWSRDKPVKFEDFTTDIPYVRDENTHRWSTELVTHVIEMKNRILEEAKPYDYLLFLDSDNILHPKTLRHLLSRKKDIITEICWTRWTPDAPEMPNAWFRHPYEFPDDTLLQLRKKKLVKVAGFGGLYLISNKALNNGITFTRVPDAPDTYWGEDRHFALRAENEGFSLWCDMVYPSFHVYRESDLPRLKEWKKNGFRFKDVGVPSVGEGVLIGICVGEKDVHPETMTWVIKTLMRNPDWGLDISRGHPIDSNRNAIVKKFMTLPEAQRYGWLLFLDSDVVPPDGAAERLVSHGKRVVGGVCWIVGENGYPTLNISKEIPAGYVKAELIEVKGMGTGFMLINREVFKKVGKSPFRFRYDKWGVANVCGEDYDFCEKAVKKGYRIYADVAVQCEHYKTLGLKKLNTLLTALVNERK